MLQEFINYINVLSGGNQFIGGVIMTFATGIIMYFLRDLPMRVAALIRKQFVTTVMVDTSNYQKRIIYFNLLSHIGAVATELGTRALSFDADYDDWDGRKRFISIGFGNHLFFYRGRPILAHRERIQQAGTEPLESLELYKFGRSHKLFHRLLSEITPVEKDKMYIYHWAKDQWQRHAELPNSGGLDSIALDAEIADKFRTEFKAFREKRATHHRLGIAHKLSYILHGLPGSGKTSIIRALASEFGMHVCILDMNAMSDAALMRAFASVPTNTIILAEDFDSARQLHRRDNNKEKSEMLSELALGTLTGLLNALEGIQALDNVVVMFTTNHLERIDPALVRPGRIDYIRQLPQPGIAAIKAHFLTLYPDMVTDHVQWGHLPGCIIHLIKQRALDDADKASELINYYVRNPEIALKEQLGRLEELEEIRRMQQLITTLAHPEPPPADVPVAYELLDKESKQC